MSKEALKDEERKERVPRGSIEVISGCMFSGKTDEFIRRLRRAPYARKKFQVFKPDIDNRRGEGTVNTYDGLKMNAISVSSSSQMLELLKEDTDWVGIDEAQFMDEDFPHIVSIIASMGKRVIVAGLDTDFRGEPFGPMPEVLAIADHSDKLYAFCNECGEEARFTQRLKKEGNKMVPADYYDEVIEVGEDKYKPRCRKCHQVPGRPY